jgi:hypothetical protein
MECRLRVFESRVLRGIFVPKRDDVTGEWRKLQNVRMIKSRRMRWVGRIARVWERTDVLRVLVGKTEGKKPLGRPRPGWEDNIKMKLYEVGCGGHGLKRAGSG